MNVLSRRFHFNVALTKPFQSFEKVYMPYEQIKQSITRQIDMNSTHPEQKSNCRIEEERKKTRFMVMDWVSAYGRGAFSHILKVVMISANQPEWKHIPPQRATVNDKCRYQKTDILALFQTLVSSPSRQDIKASKAQS